ncbi:MAG: ABC transporter ATP-binding protein [Alphaproteobacteria bacterium]
MTAAIEVTALAKQFGGLRAVDGVSLAVAPGERRALIGPNGAGKTTLFHCITGTHATTEGRIALFGEDVTAWPESARTRRGMGRTFQITNVFADLTLRENVALAIYGVARAKWTMHRPALADPALAGRIDAALERVGLAGRAGEPVRRLSYGERRQLELALALQSEPKVLLLDEPCAGLSAAERQRFMALVAELPRALTLVMIEHDMDVALGLADRVAVMHHGRVILEGSPEEARRDPQVREIYFGHG